jgi:outer membrane protein assembly factor BamB
MKNNYKILVFIFLFILVSCKKSEWEYDPSMPYPELEVGEYWHNKYDERGLQNAIIKGKYKFVNTINILEGQNYLYCLNLKNGKVQWRNEIDAYASQPVSIIDNQLYYVSYVGNIYSFSMNGKKLWSNKLNSSYSGHGVNPRNNNLLVETVTQGVYEFDKKTGKEINHYKSDSLTFLIETASADLKSMPTKSNN